MDNKNKKNTLKGCLWDQGLGHNPSLNLGWPLYAGLSNPEIREKADIDWGHPCGHNVVRGAEFSAGAQTEKPVAASPLYVRDLAGRVVHIGFGPFYKGREEWQNAPSQTFPRFCKLVEDGDVPLLEKVFLTCFRTLDMSLFADARPSGQPRGAHHVAYQHANLYPYKLRLDTFYQDGWRLPQTEHLFVVRENVNLQDSETSVADVFARWDARPPDQGYEEFYEEHNGEVWFEELFRQGVTLIPTFEAHNGYNKVSSAFTLQDYWPGRAVKGLHKVVEERPNEAPPGTILAVRRPGFALARRIEMAEVVVSDGSGYRSPHAQDPEPMLPDLRLPHTRCVAEWGACWLPTHPKHFEAPAIWGWDDEPGCFLQKRGPLWDPLHYYYRSVDEVVRACKTPLDDDHELVAVPEHMKLTFHPVAAIAGFDVSDFDVYEARKSAQIAINSAIRRIPQEDVSSTVGYHPLPLELEYELDNWWFPELAPKHRLKAPRPPAALVGRIAPVIKSHVAPGDYLSHVEGEPWWVSDPETLTVASGRPLEDFPALNRYIGKTDDIADAARWFSLHLEHVGDEILNASAYRLWPDDRPDVLDRMVPGFYASLADMREKGLDLLRFRHQLYREDIDAYYLAFWMMIPPDMLAGYLTGENAGQSDVRNRAREMSDYLSKEDEPKVQVLTGSLGTDTEKIS